MTQALRTLAAITASLVAAQLAVAQYPAKPIRIIVPFAPGGGTDITARLVSQPLAEKLGQPVILEHRPGAGSVLGTELAAKSQPDGYTLLIVAPAHAINPSLYPEVKYDPIRDFAAITMAVSFPYVIAVHPSLQVHSLKELIEYARANPGRLSYASAGTGSTPHLAGELFKRMTGVDITHIPYKGGGPALNDAVGGHVSMIFGTVLETMPQVHNGKLRGLAMSNNKRISVAPDIPAASETVPGYDVTGWYAFLAPAGTPDAIVGRLGEELGGILASASVRERFLATGGEAWPTSRSQASAFIASEVSRWRKVIKEAHITPD
jgi:tripartite-type tricarboxylate transporter receptor subunit TctC